MITKEKRKNEKLKTLRLTLGQLYIVVDDDDNFKMY